MIRDGTGPVIERSVSLLARRSDPRSDANTGNRTRKPVRAWTRGMAGGVLNLRFGDESRVAVRWFFTVKTLEP